MMGPSHRAAAAPLGIGLAFAVPWGAVGGGLLARLADGLVHVLFFVAVVGCSKWNDLDHPRFHGRIHVGAWLVRVTARAGYRLRTSHDRYRADLHRGPSHCLEWCVLVGLAAGALTSRVPFLAPWWAWWALAIFLGTASHVLLDALTPSGVPISALYNLVRYREVWRRHAFTWRWRSLPVVGPWVFDEVENAPEDGDGGLRTVTRTALGPIALLAWAAFPSVRATTSLGVRVERGRLPIPYLGVMSVDEKAPGCSPGIVTTDSGAEHLILLPLLWGASATAVLAGVGLLLPLLDLLTRSFT